MTSRKGGKRAGAGRPKLEPTQELRDQVKALAAYLEQDDLCQLIINPVTGKPIDGKSLRKHFREELDTGAPAANAKVAESLFFQAVGRPAQYFPDTLPDGTPHPNAGKLARAELKPDVTACIYWTKARMGWSEPVSLKNAEGKPFRIAITETDSKL